MNPLTAPLTDTRTVRAEVSRPTTHGAWEVRFHSEAIPGTLATFAGVLSLANLDIHGAVVRKTDDGMVHDVFEVRPLDDRRLTAEDARLLAARAADALHGRFDLEAALAAVRRQAVADRPSEPARIETLLDSDFTTGINVRAVNRIGLLHDIAATFTAHNLRTRSLTVLTIAGRANDYFRVVHANGHPPRDQSLLEAVTRDLIAVAS